MSSRREVLEDASPFGEMVPFVVSRPPAKPRRIRVKPDAVYEAELQAECDRIWQVHEKHGFTPDYRSVWDPHQFQVLAADDFLLAAFWIDAALQGREYPAEMIEFSLLTPPRMPEREPWERLYFAEAELNPGLFWALEKSFAALAKRAGLWPDEATAVQLWTEGATDSDIATRLHHRRQRVKELREAGMAKLKALTVISLLADQP